MSLSERLRDGVEAPQWVIDEVRKLETQLETERMRLAACGAVALANTPDSAKRAREMLPEYWSASLDDVIRAVDSEMALREQLETERDNNFIADRFTEIIAMQIHYLERVERLSMGSPTADKLRELYDGWLIRYRIDPIFNTRVKSVVSQLMVAINTADNLTGEES